MDFRDWSKVAQLSSALSEGSGCQTHALESLLHPAQPRAAKVSGW